MIIELLVLLLIVVFVLCKNVNRLRGLPPGPTPFPIVGNVFQISMERFDTQINEYKKEYGGIFTLWLPFPTVIICDYDMLKRNVIRNGEAFAGRPDTFVMDMLVQGNYGLFFMENYWYKAQRKFTSHIFRSLGVGQAGTQETIANLASGLVPLIEKEKGEPMELRKYLVHAVGNVIHKHLFGFTREWDEKEIFDFHVEINEVLEHFTAPKTQLLDAWPCLAYLDKPLQLGIPTTMKANNKILDRLERTLETHKKAINYDEEPTNYIDAYLKEIKLRMADADIEGFTEKQLVVAIYDLYSAGMETIIIVIRFAFLYMLNNPEAQSRIHEELDNVVGRERGVVMDDQKLLPYTCAFLQEVYRLGYVLPVNFLRCTLEDTKCEGYNLRAGTRIIAQFQSAHIDAKHFEDPEVFSAERFLQNGQFVRDERIMPFSIGKRSCLGEYLARMEVFLYFCTLLQKFEWKPEGDKAPPVEVITSSLRAPTPFKLRAIPRY
ncbi:unnamed protein product [Caenorhabditis auriculariae]|uniref:Cytochrome P450 n=1 Tax=Caenorhabditis auriculariae TaxID=2777116 RepID=A0A8S1GSF1_9PELO|nr:unnamed protein product [Caenorhabditis auriculariae]